MESYAPSASTFVILDLLVACSTREDVEHYENTHL